MLQAIIIGTLQVLQADADIYHAHIEKAFPACYFAARLRHKPIIFDAPEITLSDRVLLRWRRVNAFVTFLFASVVPHCEGVITASPLFAEEIRKRYRAVNVTVILNVPRYQVVPPSNRLRQYLGLGSEVRIALYQGAIQANRGLDVLVYAAPYLDTNTVIVMMGYGPEDTKEQLTTLIAQEGVGNRVKIIPAAPYTELLSWTALSRRRLNCTSPTLLINHPKVFAKQTL